MKTVAKENGRYGIRCNVVCPGLTFPKTRAEVGGTSMWHDPTGMFTPEQVEKIAKACRCARSDDPTTSPMPSCSSPRRRRRSHDRPGALGLGRLQHGRLRVVNAATRPRGPTAPTPAHARPHRAASRSAAHEGAGFTKAAAAPEATRDQILAHAAPCSATRATPRRRCARSPTRPASRPAASTTTSTRRTRSSARSSTPESMR